MFPMDDDEWRALSIEIKILPQKAPGLGPWRCRSGAFVSERLNIADHAIHYAEGSLKRRTVAETPVPVDCPDTFA